MKNLLIPQFKIMFALLATGIMLGLSQPIHWPPFINFSASQNILGILSLFGYVPLLVLVHQTNLKQTFFYSLSAITICNAIVIYWIYIVLHVYGYVNIVLSIAIMLLLAVVMTLIISVFFVIGRFLSQRRGIDFFWTVPLLLCAGEYCRSMYPFGGFPWGHVGYSLGRIDQFLQLASVVGVYGVVFFIGVINALLAWAYVQRRYRYHAVGLALVLVVANFIFGTVRLHGHDRDSPTIKVALLQGNIPQAIKSSSRQNAEEILANYNDLMTKAKLAGAELAIWPETAYPRSIDRNGGRPNIIRNNLASIVGAVAYNRDTNDWFVHNSGFHIDYLGELTSRYDKSHLVPFGEYVPWPLGSLVDKVVPGMGAFRPGLEFIPTNLAIAAGKQIAVGTTVCYEGIFPEISRAYANNGASLLTNLTNDAWFGDSSAPHQHLLMYRMRSAEAGLPFVRATNTGVSAWVDAYGGLHQSSTLFARELVLVDLPLVNISTIYRAIGNVVPILSLLLLILGYIASVLPVHIYVRERRWSKLILVGAWLVIAITSYVYFSRPQFLTDESAGTKNLLLFLLSLLALIGLLNQTARTRSILMVVAVIVALWSLLLVALDGPIFLIGCLVSLLLYLLAFRIKRFLQRAPE